MNLKNNTILASLKAMKPRDFAYPVIVILFFAIVVILFFSATQFISGNITKSFSADQVTNNQSLNSEHYLLVAKKLGISTSTKDAAEIPAIETISTEAVPIETQSTSTVPLEPVTLDKKSLSITILNSTTKSGVATNLAKALVTAGYGTAKIGNEKKLYATTTILIKESKSGFIPILLEDVKKIYPNVVATTTPETASSDATIIIGADK